MAGATPDGARRRLGRRLPDWIGERTVGFILSLVGLAAVFAYDYSGMAGTYVVGRWNPVQLDWLYLLSLLLLCFYVAVPLARDDRTRRRYWQRYRQNRLAVVALGYLAVVAVFGTLGPVVLGRPAIEVSHQHQPPIGFTAERAFVTAECLSENVGTAANPRCAGTWRYPLGTDQTGKDMIRLMAMGARVTLLVGLVAAMLVAPIATAVGTVAGYAGGLVEDVLMGYVDVQQTVPAFVVYVILIFLLERSLFLIVAVFGLLSWGGTARLVRSEVRQVRQEAHVQVARSLGASHLGVIRRHVLPEVASTVIASTARLVPLVVLTEAAIAYLGLSDAVLYSWGYQIGDAGIGHLTWWVWLFPTLGLGSTVLAVTLVADGIRDALDPRSG